MVEPLSNLSFQEVFHNCYNNGRGMYYPICGLVHIEDPLLLIGKINPQIGCSRFPLSQFEWSFYVVSNTIYL